jgi:hypothetical protein
VKEKAPPFFLLIAGNILEAARFAKYAGLPNPFWQYVSGPEAFHGLRGSNVKAVKLGTWFKRKDIKRIEASLLLNEIETSIVTVKREKQKKNRYVAILQSVLVRIDLVKFPRIRWNLKRKENE